MNQQKPERKWKQSGELEDGTPTWSSHERSKKHQCKCGLWVKDDQEEIDNHILRRIR